MTSENEKKRAAEAALEYINEEMIIGVGTGSTTNYFIDALAAKKDKILGAVASSYVTENKLKAAGVPVVNINYGEIALYVDGADEFNQLGQLIKGGGGALTREKIVAACAKTFICIVDSSKKVGRLGTFPLPIEVIPMARSYVARQIMALGGDPVYREGFVTDNNNQIIDVHQLEINEPIKMETQINNITGVVCNGLFAMRSADIILIGDNNKVTTLHPSKS